MKLYDFAHHPDFCGDRFSDPSWDAHRVIWRLYDGDAALLDEKQREIAYQLLGCRKLPTAPPDELFEGFGRRCGKTTGNSVMGVHAAAMDYREPHGPLKAGEWAYVACVCPDRRQASVWFDQCRGIIESSPVLGPEVTALTADTIEFSHGTRLIVLTNSFRTIRGYTLALAIIDESAFLRDENSSNPDIELYRAVRPSLRTLNGRLVVTSSLHRKTGLMWDKYCEHYGKVS